METPFTSFLENAEHVVELFTLHKEKNKFKKTHHDSEILVKSGVVLFVACWEAFIEDTAERAVDYLVDNADTPSKLPKELLKFIAAELRGNKNELKVWDIAGDGWKNASKDHYKTMLAKHLGPFNTPRAGNIDNLYAAVLGIDNVSACWVWKGMTNKNAKDRLNKMIALRGAIAHRVQASERVSFRMGNDYAIHLLKLAIKTSNRVRKHVGAHVGSYPWPEESYRSIK